MMLLTTALWTEEKAAMSATVMVVPVPNNTARGCRYTFSAARRLGGVTPVGLVRMVLLLVTH
jgi:hypothetical protein